MNSQNKPRPDMDRPGQHWEKFIQYFKGTLPSLEEEIKQYKALHRDTSVQINRLEEEKKTLEKEIDGLGKERDEKQAKPNTELNREIERLTRKYEEKDAENVKMKDEINLVIAEKLSLEEICESQKLQMQELEKKVRDMERKEKEQQYLEHKYKSLHKKLEETEKELEDTKLRLSEVFGHQVADKNPNIADLSDPNRPTKLGEMFLSLYDDEYTNAYEEIYNGDDKETCRKLLGLLMEAKKFCDDKAEEQFKSLKRECLGLDRTNTSQNTSLVDYSLKEMKDIRKKNAMKSLDGVYRTFIKQMTYTKFSKIFEETLRYLYKQTVNFAKKCVELCWFMAVQDPPLVFGPVPKRNDRFDASAYREYTKSGTLVDFPVWPALYLHENGPVLSKGVVEPMKESWPSDRHDFRSHDIMSRDRLKDSEISQSYGDIRTSTQSRPVSTPDTNTYEGEIDVLFNDQGRHGYFSGQRSSSRNYTSNNYRREILPTSNIRRHSPSNYSRSSSHLHSSAGIYKPWKY